MRPVLLTQISTPLRNGKGKPQSIKAVDAGEALKQTETYLPSLSMPCARSQGEQINKNLLRYWSRPDTVSRPAVDIDRGKLGSGRTEPALAQAHSRRRCADDY
jgi:hypothetical protein